MSVSFRRVALAGLVAATLPASASAQTPAATTPAPAAVPTAAPTPAPPTPPAPTAGALAAFTSVDPYPTDDLPVIAAAGDTVAWSQTSADGKEWQLRVAVGGKLLDPVFERAKFPIDVSLGIDGKGRTVMLWSRCSPNTTAKTRWQAYGCDLRRITDPANDSISRLVSGASRKGGAEFAPSRDGDLMVFARRHYGSNLVRLYQRDLTNGRETKLPIGPKHGSCDSACRDRGEIANGAVESSVVGNHFAMRWIDNPGDFGESYNDTVHRGTKNHLLSQAGLPGLVSGTCSSRRYNSVQLLSYSVTQFVLREYSCDDTFGSVAGGRVRRVTQGDDARDYVDPGKRRIVAAASVGDALWAVRERLPVSPPQEGVPENPQPCTAWVGGCEVVRIDDPDFVSAGG